MSDVIRIKDTQRTITGLNKKILRILNAEHSKYMVGVRREIVGIIRKEIDENVVEGTGFKGNIRKVFKNLKSETSERGRAGIYARHTKSSITVEFWANDKSEGTFSPTGSPIGFNQYFAIKNALLGREESVAENGGNLAMGKKLWNIDYEGGTTKGYSNPIIRKRVKPVNLKNENWYDEAVDKMAERIAAIRR